MSQYQLKELNEAIDATDVTLEHLIKAKKYIKKADRWGILDIVGGGIVISALKHEYIDKFNDEMKLAIESTKALSNEIKDISNFETIDFSQLEKDIDLIVYCGLLDLAIQDDIEVKNKNCKKCVQQIQKLKEDLELRRRKLENENNSQPEEYEDLPPPYSLY